MDLFKLYTGCNTADQLLTNNLYRLINKLKSIELIKDFFFIRYTDPDFHLRIRIFVTDIRFVGEIIQFFYKEFNPFVNNDLIWRIQLDTYNREFERYNPKLISETESFFAVDSECIIKILKIINKTNNEDYRWMISLVLIDNFLSDFSLTVEQKQFLINNMSESFRLEFGFNQYNMKQFNNMFREKKETIETVLNRAILDQEFKYLYSIVDNRSEIVKPIIKRLNTKCKQNNIDMNKLLSSYIHMTFNRLFRSQNRLHELILYDFMRRHYASVIARKKNVKENILIP